MYEKEEEIKFKEIVKTLNSLQRVNAPAGFEADLMRRINSGNFKEKTSFLNWILSPSRLIPSSAAAAAVVLLLFFYNPQSPDLENPLTTDPRVREDIVQTGTVTLNAPLQKPGMEISTDRKTDSSSARTRLYSASASNSDLVINKSGLNFRQIHLSDSDREQLNRLKAKISSFLSSTGSRNNE
jgi:hypothetical protein